MPDIRVSWWRRVSILSCGCLVLTAGGDHSRASGRKTAASQTAMYAETARSASAFFNSIGVNVHLNYFDRAYGNFAMVQRELGALGVKHLRDGAHLQSADYNSAVYTRWITLGQMGIRFDVVLDPRSGLGPLSADKLEYIDSLAGGSIESFEGPNELDISGIANWSTVDRQYQHTIYAAVQAIPGPRHVKVIGPSLAAASNGAQLGDISSDLDYGNLHPYPACKPPSVIFPKQIDLAHEVSGAKPIVVTESGYHNAFNDHHDQPAVSEAAASKYIPRLFLENFSHGIVRTYLYEFLDEAPDEKLTDLQQHWGLIRVDGTEKPAFHALQNLMNEVRDDGNAPEQAELRYSLKVHQGRVHQLLLAKSNGNFLLILWQPATAYDCISQAELEGHPVSATLTLEKNVKSIRSYEPVLQQAPLHIYSQTGQLSLEVSDSPLVLEIETR